MRKAISSALALLFLLVLAPARARAVKVGQAAPEFSLKAADGKVFSGLGLRGNVVVINFWAAWCPPCVDGITLLNSLYRKYGMRGLKVFGITKETAKQVKDFEAAHPIDYPVLIDSHSVVHALYGVMPIPATFLIDSNGIIVKKYIGPLPAASIDRDIRTILR